MSDALGDGVKRVYEGELAAMKKLRRVPGVVVEAQNTGRHNAGTETEQDAHAQLVTAG